MMWSICVCVVSVRFLGMLYCRLICLWVGFLVRSCLMYLVSSGLILKGMFVEGIFFCVSYKKVLMVDFMCCVVCLMCVSGVLVEGIFLVCC